MRRLIYKKPYTWDKSYVRISLFETSRKWDLLYMSQLIYETSYLWDIFFLWDFLEIRIPIYQTTWIFFIRFIFEKKNSSPTSKLKFISGFRWEILITKIFLIIKIFRLARFCESIFNSIISSSKYIINQT